MRALMVSAIDPAADYYDKLGFCAGSTERRRADAEAQSGTGRHCHQSPRGHITRHHSERFRVTHGLTCVNLSQVVRAMGYVHHAFQATIPS